MKRNVTKVQIFKAKIDRYWYAKCPCGWWYSHRDHRILREITQRHWAWSMRHAAHRVVLRSLDRFNVGGPV